MARSLWLPGSLAGAVATSYTFSKSIDNASNERGVSDFDRPHILSASYIYEVPRITRQRFAGLPINGRRIPGVTRINSGPAFDIVMSQDVAPVTYPKTVDEWFSVASFGRPVSGTFGNLGRNTLRRRGIDRWDASLMKNFHFAEKAGRYLQFRAGFFNAPNHPSFTTVAAGVDPTQNSFGAVTGIRDARVLQFALKLYF